MASTDKSTQAFKVWNEFNEGVKNKKNSTEPKANKKPEKEKLVNISGEFDKLSDDQKQRAMLGALGKGSNAAYAKAGQAKAHTENSVEALKAQIGDIVAQNEYLAQVARLQKNIFHIKTGNPNALTNADGTPVFVTSSEEAKLMNEVGLDNEGQLKNPVALKWLQANKPEMFLRPELQQKAGVALSQSIMQTIANTMAAFAPGASTAAKVAETTSQAVGNKMEADIQANSKAAALVDARNYEIMKQYRTDTVAALSQMEREQSAAQIAYTQAKIQKIGQKIQLFTNMNNLISKGMDRRSAAINAAAMTGASIDKSKTDVSKTNAQMRTNVSIANASNLTRARINNANLAMQAYKTSLELKQLEQEKFIYNTTGVSSETIVVGANALGIPSGLISNVFTNALRNFNNPSTRLLSQRVAPTVNKIAGDRTKTLKAIIENGNPEIVQAYISLGTAGYDVDPIRGRAILEAYATASPKQQTGIPGRDPNLASSYEYRVALPEHIANELENSPFVRRNGDGADSSVITSNVLLQTVTNLGADASLSLKWAVQSKDL